MEFKDSIKTILHSLAGSLAKETAEENKEVFDKLKTAYVENPRFFMMDIEIASHQFNNLISQVIDAPKQKNINIVPYVINGLFEHFHKSRITKLEGMSCSADKSGFIKDKTIEALKSNQNLSLYDDYKNADKIINGKDRQAYWSPTTVKDTDEAMKLFWDWYLLDHLSEEDENNEG